MKKITNTLMALALMATANFASAQNSTCCQASTTAPEIPNTLNPTGVAIDQSSPGLGLTQQASADLPTIEFLVTKKGQAALDAMGNPDTTGGGGDVVIGGVDAFGRVVPGDVSRYGVTLAVGDTFEMVPVGYDLGVVKNLADSLLNGKASSGASCCNLFILLAAQLQDSTIRGFCDTVRNAGVNGASDINNIEDVLVIIDAFSSAQISIESLVSIMQTINAQGSNISAECGGTGANDFFPYGVNGDKRYGYEVEVAVAVEKLSDVSSFMMYPNPSLDKIVNVNFTTTKQVELNMNVYNTLGERIATQSLGNVEGNISTVIDTGVLSAGMYFVELTDGTASQTHKLIVR